MLMIFSWDSYYVWAVPTAFSNKRDILLVKFYKQQYKIAFTKYNNNIGIYIYNSNFKYSNNLIITILL